MSDATTYTYAYFDVVNFTNEFATSGYASPICPFTFKPSYDTSVYSNKRILWDFGDGTTSKSVTATHSYQLPGDYKVTLHLYDGRGESYYDSFSQLVHVTNFIDDAITLSAANLKFATSSLSNLFEIFRFNSWQTYQALSAVGYSIALAASGNNAPFITQKAYNSDKFAHLKKSSQFYQYVYNSELDQYDYVATDSVLTDNVELYARIDNNRITFCESTHVDAILVGTSGRAVASYKDDISTSTSPTLIFASFDHTNFKDLDSIYIEDRAVQYPVIQSNAQSFYCTLAAGQPAAISITSNGLSSMPINSVQFVNIRIPFVIQIVDASGSACKYQDNLKRVSNFGTLSANTIQLSVIDATTHDGMSASFVDNFGFFADYNTGIYKGYVSLQTPTTGAKIFARAQVDAQVFTLTSNAFTILPGGYSAAKINEDFDAAGTFKSYRFQETLIGKDNFFDNFYGTIVGGASAATNAIGKRMYEKIANFVANTQDIDVCNIPALYSLKQMLEINIKQFERYNFSVPSDLTRLMDLLSIKHSKLWGTPNVWAENFDKKGLTYSDVWGINLGTQLDALTTILTAGANTLPIVAYEKFSDTFKLINTDALSSTHLTFIDGVKQTYALSSYNNFWGWGLVLPEDFTPQMFDKYYIFYEYNPTPAANILDSTINWNDNNTTIVRSVSSLQTWTASNGTMQTMLANALFTGLNLFSIISGTSAQSIEPTISALLLDDSSTVLTLDDDSLILQLA